MKKYILMIFLGWCLGCAEIPRQTPSQTESPSSAIDIRHTKSHLELSYSDLQEVLLMVQATVDGTNGCPIESDRTLGLSQSLKRSLDERYFQDRKNFSVMNLKSRIQILNQDCQATASCTVFYGFIDYLKQQDHVFHPEELKIIQSQNAVKDQVTDFMASSSVNSKWVCTSRIFKKIQDF